MEVWKGAMTKLKKASRWGAAGKSKGERKKRKAGGEGGDAASVASGGGAS
jgi:hypothetical protein